MWNRPIRRIAIIVCLMAIPPAKAGHVGYVIAEENFSDFIDFPEFWFTREALSWRHFKKYPFDGDQLVSTLPSGHYVFNYYFTRSDKKKMTTYIDSTAPGNFRLFVRKDTINFLGSIEPLFSKNDVINGFAIKVNDELLDKACLINPELFDDYPIRFAVTSFAKKQFKYNCETGILTRLSS